MKSKKGKLNVTKFLAIPFFLVSSLTLWMLCCSKDPGEPHSTIRLAGLFHAVNIEGQIVPAIEKKPQSLWKFDGSAPIPADVTPAITLGWRGEQGVEGLVIQDGRLTGRTTSDHPILSVERTDGYNDPDMLHSLEIRLRVSAGSNLHVNFTDMNARERQDSLPWTTSTPVIAGEAFQTYTLTPQIFTEASHIRQVLLQPTDVKDATFEIESVRLIFQHEYLDSIPSGVSWQGLNEIYHETLVSRAPESIHFALTLPGHPWLDLSLGAYEEEPVTFRVHVIPSKQRAKPEGKPLLERTLTTAMRWEPARVDLSRYAGQAVELIFSLSAAREGVMGFWGSPVVRSSEGAGAKGAGVPQGVILVWCDTLRWDHLNLYGYGRETAPFLTRMAEEGLVFEDCQSQATWTKVSTPSFLTSLYPATHGVKNFKDRIAASVTTIAEVFRDAGYATLSYSSVPFTGKFTNLHQGFEELHEVGSWHNPEDPYGSKSARIYVDRLLPWLERHKDVPYFVFLHVLDPHDPFEPRPPYNTLWGDPSYKKKHEEQVAKAKEFIQNPLMKMFGMPTLDEFKKTGYDPDEFVNMEKAWYDGSIRGMDTDVRRLLERLREAELDDKTLVVFTSDHGEEFFDHNRTFHGHSVYSELSHVPLIMRWPGHLPEGVKITETVRSIDIMPTVLQLCRLPIPREAQGQSMVPLFATAADGQKLAFAAPGWESLPAVTEQNAMTEPPSEGESFGIIQDGWKLIHYTKPVAGYPVDGLYDHRQDPLDHHNLAYQHPDIVERLKKALDEWKANAGEAAEKIKSDSLLENDMSSEDLEHLRSLGYVK